MVAIDAESRKPKSGITVPTRCFIPLVFVVALMTLSHIKRFMLYRSERGEVVHKASYVESKPVLRNPTHIQNQCKLYLAESAMAKGAGLGIFSGIGMLPGEAIGTPDICVFIGDAPREKTHIRSHTFGWASFWGQYEGSNSRAACEGIPTIFNTNGVVRRCNASICLSAVSVVPCPFDFYTLLILFGISLTRRTSILDLSRPSNRPRLVSVATRRRAPAALRTTTAFTAWRWTPFHQVKS